MTALMTGSSSRTVNGLAKTLGCGYEVSSSSESTTCHEINYAVAAEQ